MIHNIFIKMAFKSFLFSFLGIFLLGANLLAYESQKPTNNVVLPNQINPSELQDAPVKIKLKVKGNKVSTLSKDVNKNTRIYTRDILTNNNYFTIYNALEKTPGVTINSAFKDVIDIRGQGEDAQRRVQVLFDDIPLNILDNTHFMPGFNIFPSQAIEKVEILPGGGSIVYGNGTQGGVVNILTNFRDTLSKPNNQIFFGLASFNTKKFGASLGNYFLKDKLFIQLDYNKSDDNAYARKEWAKKQFINFSTKYSLTENHIIGYSYTTYQVEGVYTNNITKYKLKEDWRAHGDLHNYNRNETFYKASYQGKFFDNITIDDLAFYHEHTYIQKKLNTKSGTITDGQFPQNVKGNKLKGKLVYGNNEQNFLLIGNDIINTKFEIISSLPKCTYEKNTYAVFALNKMYWKQLYLLSGYRFNLDHWNKKYPKYNQKDIKPVDYIEAHDDKIYNNYNIGLGIDFNKNNTTWINFETGFTAPESLAFANKLGTQNKPNPNIKYETFKTIELGTEHQISSSGTYLRAVLFNTYTKNEISTLSNAKPPIYSYYLNIGNSVRNGLEVNLEQYIYKDIVSLTFGATAINAKYKDINHTALMEYIEDMKNQDKENLPPEGIDKYLNNLLKTLESRKGKTIKKVPPITLNSRLNIKIIEPLTFAINVHYISPYMINYKFEDKEKAGGKLITDVNITYQLDKLYLTLGINNLTNEKYFITDNYVGVNMKTANIIKGSVKPAMPINYFFDIKLKF